MEPCTEASLVTFPLGVGGPNEEECQFGQRIDPTKRFQLASGIDCSNTDLIDLTPITPKTEFECNIATEFTGVFKVTYKDSNRNICDFYTVAPFDSDCTYQQDGEVVERVIDEAAAGNKTRRLKRQRAN